MNSKNLHRIGFISNNALRQVLVSLFGMAIPFMVIHYSSKEIWGSFVAFLLFSLLSLQIVNWGNKEYLLRKFSLKPNEINFNYTNILLTRLPLILIFTVIGLCYFSLSFGFFVALLIFGRYLNQSTEVLVLYQKKFGSSVIIEIVCFIIFCIAFYALKSNLDLYTLLLLYSLYQLIKGIGYFLLFRDFLQFKKVKIDFTYYKTAFPFFLLSVLGFLASKVDVYLVQNLGNTTTTANYQVINSLLVFAMSLSAFIYSPFTKNIYRNNIAVIHKTGKLLCLSGLFIVPVSLVVINFILKYYLNLQLSVWFYLVAFIYVYPSFLYGIDVVNLFKQHREKTVIQYLLLGAVSNTVLSAFFLYLDYGITGALMGSGIAQLLVLFMFKFRLYIESQQSNTVQP